MNLKGKIFFRWAFLCLVIMVNKSTTQLTNYQLTQVVTKLEKTIELWKSSLWWNNYCLEKSIQNETGAVEEWS